MKQVVLIGDSIRMGYEATVRDRLGAVAEVWGPSGNGGNSERVLAKLDEWVLSRAPDVVHINCGLHDIKRERNAEGPVVPLQTYRANLQEIVSHLQTMTNTQFLWAQTTPVNEQRHQEAKTFDRLEQDVLDYNEAARAIMSAAGIPINDLYARVDKIGADTILVSDGVHFTDNGYLALGEAVANFICPFLRKDN